MKNIEKFQADFFGELIIHSRQNSEGKIYGKKKSVGVILAGPENISNKKKLPGEFPEEFSQAISE